MIEDETRAIRQEIAEMLFRARHHVGMTVGDLAQKMNPKKATEIARTIRNIEAGTFLPSLTFLERAAEAMGTTLVAPEFEMMVLRKGIEDLKK